MRLLGGNNNSDQIQIILTDMGSDSEIAWNLGNVLASDGLVFEQEQWIASGQVDAQSAQQAVGVL